MNGVSGNGNGGRKSFNILNRTGYFGRQEAHKLTVPIRELWNRFEMQPQMPSYPELIALDMQVLSSIGTKDDLQAPNRCRIKIVQYLKAQDRREYVDLLLTLARAHGHHNQIQSAREILQSITLGDSQNWHAYKDLAVVSGIAGEHRLALEYFEKADRLLPEYEKRFEVSEFEKWEAGARAASFRIELILKEQLIIHQESLLEILEPFFQIPTWSDKALKLYEQIRTDILQVLSEYRIPFLDVAEIFRNSQDGETAVYFYAERAIKNIVADERIEGEAAARKIMADAQAGGLIGRDTAKQLNGKIDELVAEERAAGLIDRIYRQMSKIEKGEVEIERFDLPALRDGLRAGSTLTGDAKWKEIMEDLYNDLTLLIRKSITGSGWLGDAIILVKNLSETSDEMEARMRAEIERLLGNEKLRQRICELLQNIRQRNAETMLIKGGISADNSLFKRDRVIHDFIFVGLRDLTAVKNLFREISAIAYAEPVSLASGIYGMMAGCEADPKKQRVLLYKALKEDGQNIIARIELARSLSLARMQNESDLILEGLSAQTSEPMVRLRIACIRSANLAGRMDKELKQKGGQKKLAALIEAAEKIIADAKDDYTKLAASSLRFDFIKSDWLNLHQNMANIYCLAQQLEKAIEIYERLLKEEPWEETAVVAKGIILFKQGRFTEVRDYFASVISQSPKQKIEFYYFYAEALQQLGSYQNALEIINEILTSDKKHLDFLLLKARILACTEMVEEARRTLPEIERLIEQEMPNCEPFVLQRIEGEIEMLKAEIAAILGDEIETKRAYRQAIENFAANPNSNYYEMVARWSLVNIIAKWADGKKDAKMFREALSEGQVLLRKYPYFSAGHAIIVGPLISLGKELEALEHYKWLTEHQYGLTLDAFGNLLILASNENERIKFRAKEIVTKIKGNMSPEKFRQLLNLTMEILEKAKISVGLDEELKIYLDKKSSE